MLLRLSCLLKNIFLLQYFTDDDTKQKKIKVEIKPVATNGVNPPISASVDELRSAITGLELAPKTMVSDQ